MAQPIQPGIREMLLIEIREQEPKNSMGPNLQQESILKAVVRKRGGIHIARDLQQAILTQWSELFRTGLLAWGHDINNPNPPFFHLTDRGRKALSTVTRDPSNPDGYLRHLATIATLDPVSMSYLTEGLDCYVAGLFKAAAVMVGGAAESVILDLRNVAVDKLASLGKPTPKNMKDWRIKTVSDALHGFFAAQNLPHTVRESFDAYWSAFAQQIRATRNDAGHPASVEPVTPDTVHASLLIFPELARLANNLSKWVNEDLM